MSAIDATESGLRHCDVEFAGASFRMCSFGIGHAMQIVQNRYNFSPIRKAMQAYVDKEILAGVSSAVLLGRDLVHLDCVGWADKENAIALRPDHLFRVFSNTKLITSIAVLQLMESGKLKLDDAIENYLPQLANRRVLKACTGKLYITMP